MENQLTKREIMDLHTGIVGMIYNYEKRKLTKSIRYQVLLKLREKLENLWDNGK
jgi:hypothetical protein